MSLGEKIDDLNSQVHGLELSLAAHPFTPILTIEQVLDWLNATSSAEDYKRALSARLAGTCDWILNCPEIRSWMSSDEPSLTKFLWIHGSPGFGKTILCARLIRHLQDHASFPVAYFFCYFGEQTKRHPSNILRSWVAQLVVKMILRWRLQGIFVNSTSLPQQLKWTYGFCSDGSASSCRTVIS